MSATIITFPNSIGQRQCRKHDEALRARIEKNLAELIRDRLAYFTGHLATARALFKQYPELVTAADFPEHLRTAFLEEHTQSGKCPEEQVLGWLYGPAVDYGAPVISPRQRRELRRKAKEWALEDQKARRPEAL